MSATKHSENVSIFLTHFQISMISTLASPSFGHWTGFSFGEPTEALRPLPQALSSTHHLWRSLTPARWDEFLGKWAKKCGPTAFWSLDLWFWCFEFGDFFEETSAREFSTNLKIEKVLFFFWIFGTGLVFALLVLCTIDNRACQFFGSGSVDLMC